MNPRRPSILFAILVPAALALASVRAATPAAPGEAAAHAVRVTIVTDEGSFEVELYPDRAPETVASFLARAAGRPDLAAYAGTQVCESRGSAFLVFGCQPFENTGPKPVAARKGPRPPDEIDGRAMGLADQGLGDTKDVQALWQLEVFPRYAALHDAGGAIPPGLEALVAGVRARGMAATDDLEGRSRLWYLEAIGFRYTPGRSALRVTRGALASFTMWPDDADERFLVALADLSNRDGRATVFGRVISGWDTLERIERIPVDKARRPEVPVRITAITVAEEPRTR